MLLIRLRLENFLLFGETEFEFDPGVNAVSGETGAGKSLVARALGLALGGRGGQDVIRTGAGEARIAANFHCPGSELADSEGNVEVLRVVGRAGGHISVNGKPATAQTVRQALAPLVDFAAQNEQMRLADAGYQLELLDAYGGLAGDLVAYQAAYRAAESLARRLRAGREERELVRLRLERARADFADLAEAGFDAGTDSLLEERIREISNSAGIIQAAGVAASSLEDGEPPALEALAMARRAAEGRADASPRLAEAAAELATAISSAASALARLRELCEDAGASPEDLDRLIARSEKLKALAKRFGCTVAELAATKDRLEAEIEDLAGWDAGEDATREKLTALLPGVTAAGLELGKKRRAAAKRLSKAIGRELAGLGMEQAGFAVEFEPRWQEGMPAEALLDAGASGLDEIGFFLTPNPGEAPAAIAGGVSGGEASRAMLAIKAALSDVHRPGLMFLDEVDAGVGARLGRELADKLRGMGRTRQIIVITHLPQIAAAADRHFKVAKHVRQGRTMATVTRVEGETRVAELASMIHGASAGEVTLRQAREMLREAGAAESEEGKK